MNTIETIKSNFSAKAKASKAERENFEALISAKQQKIERLQNQIKKLGEKRNKAWRKYPSWTDELIRPIIEELKKAIPEITDWDDDRLTPMGLMCRVSLFPKREADQEHTIMLCFIPPYDLDSGEILFETNKKRPNYIEPHPNSIAAMNGFGREAIKVESIEQLAEFIRSQMNSNPTNE